MGGVAGHDHAVRAAGLQFPQGVPHGGKGVWSLPQNGRSPVGDGGVAVDIDADVFAVAVSSGEGDDLVKKIRCGQRTHAA